MRYQKRQPIHHIVYWGSILLLLFFSVLWRLSVLSSFPFGYDEGIHLIVGKLWAADYVPYQEIFVSYPPIFLWSFGLTWALFNLATALQLLMVVYTLMGVLAVVYLGTVYHSRLAGVIAGILLSFAPPYFISSFSVMTETPSISLAVVAVALAEKYRRDGGWGWILLSGSTLAFGLSLKLLPVYAVPLIGLMVISRHLAYDNWANFSDSLRQSKRALLGDVTILTAGFLAVFLVPILFFDLRAFYEQVVGMRLVSRGAQVNLFSSNNEVIVDFLFGNPGLMALALYGFVFVVARNLNRYGWLIIWFLLVWASMYLHIPLRDKHLPIFLPLLAIFAGFAVHHIFDYFRGIKSLKLSLNTMSMVLVIVAVLGMLLWDVPHIVAANNGEGITNHEDDDQQEAINFIRQIATPRDCVIADDPVFLHNAQRLPPPELAEASQTRIDTGFLTLQDVVNAAKVHNCHVVAVVTNRFGKSIPGLTEWLAANYLAVYSNGDATVYFAQKGAVGDHVPLSNSNFAGLIRLDGLNLGGQPWPKTTGGYISLFWQLKAPLQTTYWEVITLRDPATGEQVYQMTRLPFEGQFDPSNWEVGQRVKDTFWLALPSDILEGDYDLYLSLCMPEANVCLAINNMPTQTELYLDQITLAP